MPNVDKKEDSNISKAKSIDAASDAQEPTTYISAFHGQCRAKANRSHRDQYAIPHLQSIVVQGGNRPDGFIRRLADFHIGALGCLAYNLEAITAAVRGI